MIPQAPPVRLDRPVPRAHIVEHIPVHVIRREMMGTIADRSIERGLPARQIPGIIACQLTRVMIVCQHHTGIRPHPEHDDREPQRADRHPSPHLRHPQRDIPDLPRLQSRGPRQPGRHPEMDARRRILKTRTEERVHNRTRHPRQRPPRDPAPNPSISDFRFSIFDLRLSAFGFRFSSLQPPASSLQSPVPCPPVPTPEQ